MPTHQDKTARSIAVQVLNQFDPKRHYAGEILNKLLPETSEKQRATDLVFGTLRNRLALDTVIAKFASCPTERIPAKVLNIIRIGAYELIFSPDTPDYSIVYEAVENTKAIAGKKQVGFVNAALRQITRHIILRQLQLSQANPRAAIPQTPKTCCEFDCEFLPDPKTSKEAYLSICFSLPEWLISNWLSEFGEQATRQICFASNRKPSIYIRPNTLKATAQQLAEKLRQTNIDCEIVPFVIPAQAGIQKTKYSESTMIKLKSPKDVTDLPGFTEGEFTVQDISAAQAVRLLNPKPDWKILDLCAAPGTKTTQLAEHTADKAHILATDIDPKRLQKVKENFTRLGLKNVTVVEHTKLFENSQFSILNSKFDAILLDVPCSNTGVLARRIEARYRLTPKAVEKLSNEQAELLDKAAKILKPTRHGGACRSGNGKICYSTCTLQKKENVLVVEQFLQKNQNFHLETEKLILPSAEEQDHDGGYIAIIKCKK